MDLRFFAAPEGPMELSLSDFAVSNPSSVGTGSRRSAWILSGEAAVSRKPSPDFSRRREKSARSADMRRG
jgi:hypothetical protein